MNGGLSAGLIYFLTTYLSVVIILGIFSLIVSIFMVVCRCIIINKYDAGKWWKGLIPYYNKWVLCDMSFNDKTAKVVFFSNLAATIIFAVLGLIIEVINTYHEYNINNPKAMEALLVLGIIGLILAIIRLLCGIFRLITNCYLSFCLSKSFGRGTAFCIFSLFIPQIMRAVLAFGPIEYEGDVTFLFND